MVLETSLGDLRQGRLSSYLTGLLGAQGHEDLPWGWCTQDTKQKAHGGGAQPILGLEGLPYKWIIFWCGDIPLIFLSVSSPESYLAEQFSPS